MCLGTHMGDSAPFHVNLIAGYESTFFCRGMDMGDNLWSGAATVDWNLTDAFTWTTTYRYLNVDETAFEESHLYTGAFWRIGSLSIGPSFRWYHNFNNGMIENAYDVGIQALFKAGPVYLSGGAYYETETEGYYYELGVSSVISVTSRLSLVPAVEVSYTDGWMMPGMRGFNHVGLRLSAPFMVTDSVRIVPWIGGNLPLEALDAHQDDRLVGGAYVSWTF